MMVKGHMVSLQQCDDKFNDMNKCNNCRSSDKAIQVFEKKSDVNEEISANDMETLNVLSLCCQDNAIEFVANEHVGSIERIREILDKINGASTPKIHFIGEKEI